MFGKSRDLKTKTPKTEAACIFLRWNKCQRVDVHSDAKTEKTFFSVSFSLFLHNQLTHFQKSKGDGKRNIFNYWETLAVF